jgi:hypothetical protein
MGASKIKRKRPETRWRMNFRVRETFIGGTQTGGGVEQLLYAGGMKLKTSAGAVVDVDAGEILRAAGAIYQARRKTHGHPPLHVFRCRWCDDEIRGRGPLDAHERDCSQRSTGPVTDADMIRLAWSPTE